MTGSQPAESSGPDGQKGRRGSYRAGFFFGTLSFGVAIGLGFASTVLTARLYGVETIGDYALVWAPVAALWVLSTIKEQQALIKEITDLTPRDPRVTQLFAAVFTFSVGLTATMALLAAIVCCFVFPGPLNAPQLLAPALVSIAGYTLVTNTGWNFDSILSAFVAGRQLFHVRLNESISFIVLVTAFGLTWKSVWGLVIATMGASAIALVHRAIVARRFAVPRLSGAEYRKGLDVLPGLLRFGLKAAPGQMALGVSQQGGIWAVGLVAPVAAVGAFSRAMVIPKNVQQASMRVTEVLFPTLVGRHSAGDGHGFDRALIDSIRYEVIGMLLLAAALGGAAHSVLDVFGPGFSAAVPALVLLLFFPVLASIAITQTQALWAVDRPGLTSLVAMVRLAVTIVLLVFLTPGMNFAGPAIALLAGMLVSVILYGFALRRHLTRPLRSTWPLRERAILVVAYAAGFGAAHAVEQAAPSLAALPLCLAAGTLAYVAVLILGGGVNRRDRERIGVLRARLRSRLGRRRLSRRPRAAVLSLALLVATLAWGVTSANANAITTENSLPGDSHWEAYENRASAATIEGYASESSVAQGGTLHLHVDSSAATYRVEVSRLGWYGGAGGRRMLCLPSCATSEGPVSQPGSPIVNGTTGELDANWTVTDAVPTGADWTSGYYVAELILTSGPEEGKTAWYPFLVTPAPGSESAILVQVPINTWQAYNPWPGGSLGRSLYGFNSAEGDAAAKVSFNRPLMRRTAKGDYYQEPVFTREVQAVRFLEREGFDVSYAGDGDVDANPAQLLSHGVNMVLGHDEYWTLAMREGWEAALAAGRNEVFLGADIGTWLVRYEDAGRTLVGYKSNSDPGNPPTVKFRDLSPPRPECELEGVQYDDTSGHPGLTDYTVASGAGGNPWIIAAGLSPGDTIHAAVGYEWDAIAPSCAVPSLETLFHYQTGPGAGNADAVTFAQPGAGSVFAAGSNMFANMLDSYGDNALSGQAADPRIQAFTRALLVDFMAAFPHPPTTTAVSSPASTHLAVSLIGDGVQPPSNAIVLGHVRKSKRRGTASLELLLSVPGTVTLSGRGVIPRTLAAPGRRLAGAGPENAIRVEVPVAPTQITLAKLRARGAVTVGIEVAYVPTGGTSRTRSTSIRLIMRHKAGASRRQRGRSLP